jgi:hypothetical protein
MTRRDWLVLATVCLATATLTAQRGGGRGGITRPTNSAFDNPEYGIRFPAPSGFDLYTAEEPGRYRRLFDQRHIAVLVNPMQIDETITVRFSGNLTDADIKGYRAAMESNPPQAKLPGYEKVSVGAAKIGQGDGVDAVEYIYKAKPEKTDETVRQLAFLHKGHGFLVTCTAEQKRFDKANKEFSRFLSSLEFR